MSSAASALWHALLCCRALGASWPQDCCLRLACVDVFLPLLCLFSRMTSDLALPQVMYLRVGDVVKHTMSQYVPMATRICLQSASNELNKLLLMMASARAGHHIEEYMQVAFTEKCVE